MSVRRAEYREGTGLLATGGGKLLFVDSVDHPAAKQLGEAVCLTRPLRSLAAVVASAEFDVPAFIYVEVGDELQSIVFGEIQLEVRDTRNTVVDGTSADPWAHSYSSADATVAYGFESGDAGDLWIESGVVRASAFRWFCRDDTLDPLADASAAGHPPPQRAGPQDTSTGQEPVTVEPAFETIDGDDASDAAPTPPRMVDALVCLECAGLNPPMTARCRRCSALLSGINSELRSVAQPALGSIHLSDERVEPVDTDLLIGRNPGRFGVGPHQRAVVHGTGDHSVSRLHLKLKLDGWSVTATNLKKGTGTMIETRLGGRARLPSGVPHPLSDGDTIFLGRSWLRYEERVLSLGSSP